MTEVEKEAFLEQLHKMLFQQDPALARSARRSRYASPAPSSRKAAPRIGLGTYIAISAYIILGEGMHALTVNKCICKLVSGRNLSSVTKPQLTDLAIRNGSQGKTNAALWFNGHKYTSGYSLRCTLVAAKSATDNTLFVVYKGNVYAL